MNNSSVLAAGLIERITEEQGKITHKVGENKQVLEKKISNHNLAIRYMIELLTDSKTGVIKDKLEIQAIGHRVVHGGEKFHSSTLISQQVIEAIRENIPLAPLHNPANLIGIEACQNFLEICLK